MNGRNKIQAINTWAVALLRYGAGIIDWRVDELKKIDRTTRKKLNMYGAIHPKGNIDRLYVKRKEGGRGLISIESCVRSEENNLGLYIRESNKMLLKGVKKGGVIQTDYIMEKNEFKRSYQTEIKIKWREKRLYGQFVREMPEEVDKELSWQWITRGDLKVQAIFAAQEQALRTTVVSWPNVNIRGGMIILPNLFIGCYVKSMV